MNEGTQGLSRLGGIALAIAGVGFFIAGALHPHGSADHGFREAITAMLEDPMWPAVHWFALTSAMLAVWGIWLLLDGGWARSSVAARAGSRLVIAAGIFMAVQFSVEIGARSAVEIYAEGRPAPLVDLVDPMQAVGWPALAVGFIVIAIGVPGSAPRWVIILGIAGAGALGVAGVLAQGLHLLQAAPLFIGGNLLAVWMMWAGLRVARRINFRRVTLRISADHLHPREHLVSIMNRSYAGNEYRQRMRTPVLCTLFG